MTVDQMLTIQQVTDRLQIADETVYRYIRQGKLKAVRVGGLWRVRESDLERFLQGGQQ